MRLNVIISTFLIFAAAPISQSLSLNLGRNGLSKYSSSSTPVKCDTAIIRPSRKFGISLQVAVTDDETTENIENDIIPMTILSGFLGSGKTTALKNLLENKAGVKVGVVVNDVADVNIDAKLIANESQMDQDDTVELQNGCACCSLADELLASVQSLTEKRDFDAIIVELSGVADPVAVKDNWENAKLVSSSCTLKRCEMIRYGWVCTLFKRSCFFIIIVLDFLLDESSSYQKSRCK